MKDVDYINYYKDSFLESGMAKKLLALIDADQTSFPYLENFCERHNGIHGTNWNVAQIQTYDLTAAWGISAAELQAKFDEFNAEHLANLPAVDGAVKGIRQLKELGYEIACASDRPLALQTDTELCYQRAFGGSVQKVYLTGRSVGPVRQGDVTKGALCRDLGAVVMIEDSLERAREVRDTSEGTTVFLFGDYKWNRGNGLGESIIRTVTWEDVVREAEKLKEKLGF
jgi:hypothetical protein